MNYQTLLNKIKNELDVIERNIENNDQRVESIRAAWMVGCDAYTYKQETGIPTKNIADDIGASKTNLDRFIRFYRVFRETPTGVVNGKPVVLSHYLELIYIYDPKEREFYLNTAAEKGWSSTELRRRVRNSFYESYCDSVAVQVHAGIRPAKALKVIPQHLYTYSATVLKIVDADTLVLEIDVGFRLRTEQKVRLRGINCAERGTTRGEKATAFVQQQLLGTNGTPARHCSTGAMQRKKQNHAASAVSPEPSRTDNLPTVLVRTYKSEKYGRYLVDIWYLPGETDPENILANGRWLNQELLDNNLAVKVE